VTVHFSRVAARLFAMPILFCAATVSAQEKVTVRMDFIAWGTHAAMHLANERGWFKEVGLDVTVQDGTGSNNTIQLVGTGQVDVGQVQLGVMPIARENGLQVRSIAAWFRKADLAVLVDRDSPAKTVKDLAGKTLVVFPGSPWTPYIDSYLRTGGQTRDTLKILNVAPAAMVSTYTAKQADGVMTPAPFGMPLVESTRPSKALLMADAGIAFPSYGLIASESTIEKRADMLRKMIRVQARAWDYIYAGNVDEAVQAIIKQRPNANLNPVFLKGQIEGYKAFIHTANSLGKPTGVQNDADWVEAIRDMERTNVIKPGRKPGEFYTNSLIN